MPRVKFIDVGRNKMTWEETLDNVDSDTLAAAIKRKGALRSSDVWIEASFIFAGFRCVGKTELLTLGRRDASDRDRDLYRARRRQLSEGVAVLSLALHRDGSGG